MRLLALFCARKTKFLMEVGLAILYTFNKAVAAGGGDENTARDQNRAWGHLRQVHEALPRRHPIHIGAIGHTGKDETRGARAQTPPTVTTTRRYRSRTKALSRA